MPYVDPLAESPCGSVAAVRLGLLPRDAATSRLDEIRLEDLVPEGPFQFYIQGQEFAA
jgi:hypothetical protein